MLEELKKQVLTANLSLVSNKLVLFTWGNVSAIDRVRGLVVIKPSGVSYDEMSAEDMVVVDLDGKRVEGKLRPSVDLPTHLELYKSFSEIGGVCHTHSAFATSFAQVGRPIIAYGTTHADYFYGDIPCTRGLSAEEINGEYEKNTGRVIVETVSGTDVMAVPGILVKSHGVFTWGKDGLDAAHNAAYLEECAHLAKLTEENVVDAKRVDQFLLDRHYLRKHGKNATYGQDKK